MSARFLEDTFVIDMPVALILFLATRLSPFGGNFMLKEERNKLIEGASG